ncbi:hypothetical protein H2202_002010 [Exophiala xenobiotica]|nr:hypothetical protein H2202_002010 [Exophiala xenobiotica]
MPWAKLARKRIAAASDFAAFVKTVGADTGTVEAIVASTGLLRAIGTVADTTTPTVGTCTANTNAIGTVAVATTPGVAVKANTAYIQAAQTLAYTVMAVGSDAASDSTAGANADPSTAVTTKATETSAENPCTLVSYA